MTSLVKTYERLMKFMILCKSGIGETFHHFIDYAAR